MNALTRFERLDDMFPDMFQRFIRPLSPSADGPAAIRVDVNETKAGYEVRAEIPGAKKEDIRVAIDGRYVSISTEIRRETPDKADKAARPLVRELYYGSAMRGFSVDDPIDAKNAVAKFEDGVLKLTLPKQSEASSRTLNVQ
jgi:HSP20 family protein